jgi:hypothetical protein
VLPDAGALEQTFGPWRGPDLPPWHAERPHLLANALLEARLAAPHLAPLAEHVLSRAPRRPLASQTIRALTRDRVAAPLLLDEAVTCPWLALDSDIAVNAIGIDIDHADGPARVEQLARAYGLPRPLLVIDPWSGRSHLIALLRTPVLLRPGDRAGPRNLLVRARRMLAAAVNGTPLPPRALMKSPWGRTEYLIGARHLRGARPAVPALWEAYQNAGSGLLWHTEPGDRHAYELRAIIAALADDFGEAAAPEIRHRFRKQRPQPSARGRNCALFDQLRGWAYDHAETDANALAAEAARINAGFPAPLPASEVAATVRSIARFMATRYRPRTDAASRRGRDHLSGAHLTPQARRALSGQVTAAGRAAATDTKIAAAIADLRTAGARVTQAAVAAGARVSLRTVKSRWHGLGMVQDGALSGDAPPCGAPGPQARPSREMKNPSLLPYQPHTPRAGRTGGALGVPVVELRTRSLAQPMR